MTIKTWGQWGQTMRVIAFEIGAREPIQGEEQTVVGYPEIRLLGTQAYGPPSTPPTDGRPFNPHETRISLVVSINPLLLDSLINDLQAVRQFTSTEKSISLTGTGEAHSNTKRGGGGSPRAARALYAKHYHNPGDYHTLCGVAIGELPETSEAIVDPTLVNCPDCIKILERIGMLPLVDKMSGGSDSFVPPSVPMDSAKATTRDVVAWRKWLLGRKVVSTEHHGALYEVVDVGFSTGKFNGRWTILRDDKGPGEVCINLEAIGRSGADPEFVSCSLMEFVRDWSMAQDYDDAFAEPDHAYETYKTPSPEEVVSRAVADLDELDEQVINSTEVGPIPEPPEPDTDDNEEPAGEEPHWAKVTRGLVGGYAYARSDQEKKWHRIKDVEVVEGEDGSGTVMLSPMYDTFAEVIRVDAVDFARNWHYTREVTVEPERYQALVGLMATKGHAYSGKSIERNYVDAVVKDEKSNVGVSVILSVAERGSKVTMTVALDEFISTYHLHKPKDEDEDDSESEVDPPEPDLGTPELRLLDQARNDVTKWNDLLVGSRYKRRRDGLQASVGRMHATVKGAMVTLDPGGQWSLGAFLRDWTGWEKEAETAGIWSPEPQQSPEQK